MSDLISREAVIKAMENNSFMVEVAGSKRKMIDGMMMCVEIADLPTIEAVPVVHGNLIKRSPYTSKCSVCGHVTTESDANFCPNCGSKKG